MPHSIKGQVKSVALPVLLIVCAFFLFGVLLFLNQSKYAIGQAIQWFSGYQCVDSDGGTDPYTPGTTSGINGYASDYCTQGGAYDLGPNEMCDSRENRFCWLVEHYCQGGYARGTARTCPAESPVCINGKCTLGRNTENFANERAEIQKRNSVYLPYYSAPVVGN